MAKEFWGILGKNPNVSKPGEAEAIAQKIVDEFFDLRALYYNVTEKMDAAAWLHFYTAADSRYPLIQQWIHDHPDDPTEGDAAGELRLIEYLAVMVLTAAIVRKLR